MFKINIQEFIIAEYESDLKSIKNEKIIDNCEAEDKPEIRNILKNYEDFKMEVMEKIRDSADKIEIKCNANIYTKHLHIQMRNKKIELMKNQIIKVEYFQGYATAVRIELINGVYFINSCIDNELLFKYTFNILKEL